jgi:malate dehydrogenase
LLSLIDRAKLDEIVKRVQDAGGEIVGLLKTGSAFVSPAAASVAMAESVLLDQKRVLPCAAWCEGEYGAKGIYMGVPVQLGRGGVERIFEIDLSDEEQAQMRESIAHVERLVSEIQI